MKKQIALIVTVLAVACNAVEITSVVAKQRWPWNNLVDVDFEVSAPAGEQYRVQLDAKCAGGTKSFTASTYASEPIAKAGQNHLVWDFGKDYPDVRAEDMQVAVSVIPYSDSNVPLYLVVDLSAGADAASFPYRYVTTPPPHVQGATDEPCQTTELWLRRVAAPAVHWYHYWTPGRSDAFYAKMTKDYYVGVFQLTQKQYERVMGEWPKCFFSNVTCRASRPVENLTHIDFCGMKKNPLLNPSAIGANSFLGRIRAKTGLPLNLPTMVQAEYAVCGQPYDSQEHWGFQTADGRWSNDIPELSMRYGKNSNMRTANGDSDLNSGTAAVGSYLPNKLGLYDVLGNVREMTCERHKGWSSTPVPEMTAQYQTDAGDETLGTTSENPIVDPRGAYPNADTYYPLFRTGSWNDESNTWPWAFKLGEIGSWTSNVSVGFRLALTVE